MLSALPALTAALMAAIVTTPVAWAQAPGQAERCVQRQLIQPALRTAIIGPEDLAVSADGETLYLSAHDRRLKEAGGLYAIDVLDLSRPGPLRFRQVIPDIFAHGLTTDARGVHVIDRPPMAAARVLSVVDGGSTADPAETPVQCRANDLVSLGPDGLLVTVDGAACGGFSRQWELVRGTAAGAVWQWRAAEGEQKAENLAFANGIAHRDNRVYVAETRGQALRVYEQPGDGSGPWVAQESIPLDGHPDNLSWAPDGRLLVALHKDLLDLAIFRQGLREYAKGQVIALDVESGETELLYETDDIDFSAPTSAVVAGNWLVIGAAQGRRVVQCLWDAAAERAAVDAARDGGTEPAADEDSADP